MEAERRLGDRVANRWWEQKGMHIAGAREEK